MYKRQAQAAAHGARVQALLAAHPRHVLLTAVVAGLLAGPVSPAALAAALALTLAAVRDRPLALGAVVALLAGAAIADARLAALDRSTLGEGEVVVGAMLLEHPRMRSFASRVAAARVRGERVLLKAPARVRWPRAVSYTHLTLPTILLV